MKKAKSKPQAKSKLLLDMRPLQRTINRLSDTPQNIIIFYLVISDCSQYGFSIDMASRIYVYSAVMLFLGVLKRAKIDYSNLDPLGMNQWAWILHLVDITFQINAFYLLIRLVTDISLVHSSLVIIHCAYTAYTHIDNRKKVPKFRGRSIKPSKMKIAQPHILFVFCKIISRQFNQISFIFLMFSITNIIIVIQMANVIYFKNLMLNFWYKRFSSSQDNKKSTLKTRKQILKNLLVFIALLITIENLLVIFQKLRFQISLALLQSLMVGSYGYYMYITFEKPDTKFEIQN